MLWLVSVGLYCFFTGLFSSLFTHCIPAISERGVSEFRLTDCERETEKLSCTERAAIRG
jgi:hypothetical protein